MVGWGRARSREVREREGCTALNQPGPPDLLMSCINIAGDLIMDFCFHLGHWLQCLQDHSIQWDGKESVVPLPLGTFHGGSHLFSKYLLNAFSRHNMLLIRCLLGLYP